MKFAAKVWEVLDRSDYFRETHYAGTPALQFIEQFEQREAASRKYQQAKQAAAASAPNGEWIRQRLEKLDEMRANGVADDEWALEQLRRMKEEAMQRQKADFEETLYEPTVRELPVNPRQTSGGNGFAQLFGLHPAVVLLTVMVDTMIFGSGLVSGGIGWGLSIPVGVVLGVIAFIAQRKWYGDDNEAAFLKALIVAFLTAIPTSLPGYLTIPSGIVGLFRRKRI
jgi:uncharacterized membrane protein YphA (DoxX/SURF4 family)